MATTTKKTTTRKSTTTAKSTTAAKSASKSAAKPAAVVVDAPAPVVAGPMMRKKELIDAVVTRSGIKKKDAKPVVEAMLAVLGEAMAEGRELNLTPMGKLKVKRAKELPQAKVMIAKVRQPKPSATPAPTSEAAE